MSSEIGYRTLHEGEVVLADADCRARDGQRGFEEHCGNFELVFPRSGSFLRHLGGRQIFADSGQVLFFNRGESYHVSHPVSCGDRCSVLTFSLHALEPAFAMTPARSSGWRFPVTHAAVSHRVASSLHELRRTARFDPADALTIEALALSLLEQVALEVGRTRSVPQRPLGIDGRRRRQESVLITRLALARTFRSSYSLSSLAAEAGCSPFHLVRIFRAETGLPIHRYRGLLRLREALERLAGGERDLTTLALDLGYSSHSHFSDAFRAAFGVAPSGFRLASKRCPAPTRGIRKILEV